MIRRLFAAWMIAMAVLAGTILYEEAREYEIAYWETLSTGDLGREAEIGVFLAEHEARIAQRNANLVEYTTLAVNALLAAATAAAWMIARRRARREA